MESPFSFTVKGSDNGATAERGGIPVVRAPAVGSIRLDSSAVASLPLSLLLSLSSQITTPGQQKINQMSTPRIIIPAEKDVLMGRGLPYQAHPGTQTMRRLVERHKERYSSLPRSARSGVANQVLSILWRNGSRFLIRRRRSSDQQRRRTFPKAQFLEGWEVATDSEAYEKVCHALRSKNSSTPTTDKANNVSCRKCSNSNSKNKKVVASAIKISSSNDGSSHRVSSPPSSPSSSSVEVQQQRDVLPATSSSRTDKARYDVVVEDYKKLAVKMAIDMYLSQKA